MRTTEWARWKGIYEANLEVYKQRIQDKKQGAIKVDKCPLCGNKMFEGVGDHMRGQHAEMPVKHGKYFLDLPYHNANKNIADGEGFLRLYLRVSYQKNPILTYFNALNLPNMFKLYDTEGNTLRWDKIRSRFIKVFWSVMLFYLFT